MKFQGNYWAVWLLLLLTACGGGGGEQQSTEVSTNNTSQASPQPEPTSTPEVDVVDEDMAGEVLEEEWTVTQTADLVVAESFLLEAQTEVALAISVASLVNERAYVNICHVNDNDEIDPRACLLKSPLVGGELTSLIAVANDVDTLAAQIWQYSLSVEPINAQWSREHGTQWRIEL